jgi:hypothetical protein
MDQGGGLECDFGRFKPEAMLRHRSHFAVHRPEKDVHRRHIARRDSVEDAGEFRLAQGCSGDGFIGF